MAPPSRIPLSQERVLSPPVTHSTLIHAPALPRPPPPPAAAFGPPVLLTKWIAGSSASGVACDGGGNVYVGMWLDNKILKFNNTGTLIGQWGSNGTGPGQFVHPIAIAVDGNDNVYVLDED